MKVIVRKEVHLSPAILKKVEREAKKQKVKVKNLLESTINDAFEEKLSPKPE